MNNLDSWFKRTFSASSDKEGDSSTGPKKQSQSSNRGQSTGKRPPQKRHSSSSSSSSSNSSSSSKPRTGSRPTSRSNSNSRPQRSNTPQRSNASRKPLANRTPKKPAPIHKGKVRIIPIGGLNEVGKNMTAIEYEDDIIIIDIGFEFPSEDMLGIDYVVPDVSYLEDKKDRIRGVVLTHGHLDHIGGIPYILPKLNYPPVYGTGLTLGLVEKKIEEFKLQKFTKLNKITSNDVLKLGKMTCSFIQVMHSIPDCLAIVVDTPEGKIFHTGDFKFDDTPARNIAPAEIHKLEKMKDQNVLAMLCESTNALKPGHSMSEKAVGEALDQIVANTPGRLIIASFSSQIGRLQQVIDAGRKHQRQVFVSGRSMNENIKTSAKLGYIKMPPNFVKDIKQYKKVPDEKALILTTGSQGEPTSALTRMAKGEHPHLKVKKGDTIVFSSSPIIGNAKAVNAVINKLTILGAEVIHNQIADVHTSGHGNQDELSRMINYIKPKYLIPIHGEYYMRRGLVKLAGEKCGIPEENAIMLVNGSVVEMSKGKCHKSNEVVEAKYVLIDGTGEGQLDSYVQSDRETMSQNGALVVLIYVNKRSKNIKRDPEVVSRGFMYMHESKKIINDIIRICAKAYSRIREKNPKAKRNEVKRYVRHAVDDFTRKEIQRRPLIIPLIIED